MADNWRKVCIVEKDPADSGSTGGLGDVVGNFAKTIAKGIGI